MKFSSRIKERVGEQLEGLLFAMKIKVKVSMPEQVSNFGHFNSFDL